MATSATRDAQNRDELFRGVRARLGINAEVVSGQEEAHLSFRGALSGIRSKADPVLVMDSGGGSTELVRGVGAGADLAHIDASVSLNIGSRRLRERILRSDPPTADEIARARQLVRSELDSSGVELSDIRTFIGVAGTVTTMSALAQHLRRYDRSRVHGSVLSQAAVHEVLIGCWVPPCPRWSAGGPCSRSVPRCCAPGPDRRGGRLPRGGTRTRGERVRHPRWHRVEHAGGRQGTGDQRRLAHGPGPSWWAGPVNRRLALVVPVRVARVGAAD